MLKKIVAGYSIVTGVSIVGIWCLYFATGKVFGIRPAAEGLAMGLHIGAEFATAAVLAAAGAGLLAGRGWGRNVYFIGIGMLIYATVNSAGYYPGGGAMIAGVFVCSFVFAAVFAVAGFFMD